MCQMVKWKQSAVLRCVTDGIKIIYGKVILVKCGLSHKLYSVNVDVYLGIQSGVISLVVSDHSPSTPDMKLMTDSNNRGNFLKAWGGISSVQFGKTMARI